MDIATIGREATKVDMFYMYEGVSAFDVDYIAAVAVCCDQQILCVRREAQFWREDQIIVIEAYGVERPSESSYKRERDGRL